MQSCPDALAPHPRCYARERQRIWRTESQVSRALLLRVDPRGRSSPQPRRSWWHRGAYADGVGRHGETRASPRGRSGSAWSESRTSKTHADVRPADRLRSPRARPRGRSAARAGPAGVRYARGRATREGTTRQDKVAMRRALRAVGFVKEPRTAVAGTPWTAVCSMQSPTGLLRPDWREGTTTRVDWNDEPDALDVPAQLWPLVWLWSARPRS